MKKIKLYRQGDVNLLPVNNIDLSSAEQVKSNIKNTTVLAYGEVTGHFHGIPSSHAKQFRLNDKEYVQVLKPTKLRHQEHAPIQLNPGIYEKRIAREYTTVGGERKVVD